MRQHRWKILFATALFVGGVLSLSASSLPDGLEKVASDQRFLEKEIILFAAPFAEYLVPGVGDSALSTSIAGVFGSFFLFAVLLLFGRALFRIEIPKKE